MVSRRSLHKEVYNSAGVVFGLTLPPVGKRTKYLIRPTYAFSFYLLQASPQFTEEQEGLLKILAEPSIINLDDMLSSERYDRASAEITQEAIKTATLLKDCDISNQSNIYVTWASIVAVDRGGPVSFSRTLDLLTALELKLQMVWNKCYSLSNLADAVFARKAAINFREFYWEIVRTFDDAKGTLSSTSSTRVNGIFNELLITSNLANEISRLETKMILCEKFMEQLNREKDARYRKLIEILLFLTAMSQLLPVLFKTPIQAATDRPFISLIAVIVIFIVGLVAISFRK